MSDSNIESVAIPSCTNQKREWLVPSVVFLLLWGMCILTAIIFSTFRVDVKGIPDWVENEFQKKDDKSLAKKLDDSYCAKDDIFSQVTFSYCIERPSSDKSSSSEKTLVCGEKTGWASGNHNRGNLYYVNANEVVVRDGDKLFKKNQDGKIVFSDKGHRLDAYYQYLKLSSAEQAGPRYLINVSLFSALMLLFFGYSLFFLRQDFYEADRKLWLNFFLITLHLLLFICSVEVFRSLKSYIGMPDFMIFSLFPSTLVPALISNMMGRRAGICAVVSLALLTSLLAGGDYQFEYVLFFLMSSLVILASFWNVHNRFRFWLGGILFWCVTFLLMVFFAWERGLYWAFNNPPKTFWFFVSCFTFVNDILVILGVFLIPPVCEKIFDVTTVYTLDELNTREHPLMERLLKEAQGTYEHCLSVAQIAEDAARAIGANVRLARACSYFHDIGKLSNPKYFAENLAAGEANPHNNLSPEESAKILKEHVNYGIELAAKYHLPHELREAIGQHHGTSKMLFFAEKALQLAKENGVTPPDMNQFRYAGPVPQRTEVILVMVADVCEAAIRAAVQNGHDMTPEMIHDKVAALLKAKFEDGQFAKSRITLSQINLIINAVSNSLCAQYHKRPEYHEESASEAAGAKQI